MVHFSHLLFALLASLSSVSNVSGTVHEILCTDGVGDTAAFSIALQNASPGDVILLNPCEYNFAPDYDLEDDQPTNQLFSFSSAIRKTAGIIIKGMGEEAGDTVLKAVMHYLDINLLLENLTLTAEGTTAGQEVFQADNDLANVFRNCIIKSYDDNGPYDDAMLNLSHKLTLINSNLINTNMVNDASSNVGVFVEASSTYHFGLMNTKIDGFWAGLHVYNWDQSPDYVDSVNLWNADLSTATYECCTDIVNPKTKKRTRKTSALPTDRSPRRRKVASAKMNQSPRKRKTQKSYYSTCTENCPLSQQAINTPVGNNKFIYENINLMSGDNIFMAFHIKFKRVVSAGQTIVYKLPSAYPDLPPNYISGTTAQYYRFHSTAKLRKQKRTLLFFKKGVMDSNFANPSTIKVFMYFENTGTFGNNPLQHTTVTKNGVEFYKVRMPKRKRFNLMIAFGEEE